MSRKKETTGTGEVFTKEGSRELHQGWAVHMGRGRWGITCREEQRTKLWMRGYHRQIQGSRALWLRQSFHAKEIQLEYFPQLNKSIS